MTNDWNVSFDTYKPPLGVRIVISPVPSNGQLAQIERLLKSLPGINHVNSFLGGMFDIEREDLPQDLSVSNADITDFILGILGAATSEGSLRIKVVPQERNSGVWIIQTTQRHKSAELLAKLQRAGLSKPELVDRDFNISCKYNGIAEDVQRIAEEVITAFYGPPVPLSTSISMEAGQPNKFRITTNRYFGETDQDVLRESLYQENELGLSNVTFVEFGHEILCTVASDLYDRQTVAEAVERKILGRFDKSS